MLRNRLALLLICLVSYAPAACAEDVPGTSPNVSNNAVPAAAVNTYPATPAEVQAWSLPPVSYPANNPFSEAKAELGRKLFFDPRLTGNPSHTCAACHHPGLGWADAMPRAMGSQQGLGRHTPSLINIGYAKSFFWDGRATTLEDAVRQDLLSPGMSNDESANSIVQRVNDIAAYRTEFARAFNTPDVTFDRIAAALATFLRGIRSSDTPFDRWLKGDTGAISASAYRGFLLFTGKAECVRCHTSPTFSDSSFHNTGINTVDPGHYEISGKDEHRNAFKTPQLRDVALTPPYMHNGSKATLSSIIDFYDRGGDALDGGNELHALHLSNTEKKELLAFLLSLSGKAQETRIPALPLNTNP